jgi:hypothetical protein
MRARHPDLFSDSKIFQESRLTREVFEYHLDTITDRKQEYEFEHFCRKLAEKELCPNLIPQTGPTGGGDSKVDTETYPVADAISLRWYEGIGRESAQERWAFAFSAKKKWRTKVQNDVANILKTRRGYKLIFFITNQYVSDKKRSEVEDKLRKQYRIDIRIFDRGWITKCVFENNRVRLAIDSLRLTGFDEKQHKQTGPRDAERREELKALEQQISDPNRYIGVEYQLAEDCLQASLLARNLELPRVEVEGRFQRTTVIAERVGIRQQILRVAYARAWTAHWWYDDFDELNRLYDTVGKFAIGTGQAVDLELLCNLWMLMNTAIAIKKLDPEKAQFESRTNTLKTELERLAADKRRPNNALQARTSRTLMDLAWFAVRDPKKIDKVLDALREILVESEGLGSYPLEPVSTIIRELGENITGSASYDSLFEHLIKLTSLRASEAEAGKALLQRGIQELRADKNYEAVRLLGRAQQKLSMDEHRNEWITALAACGSAYESAGLLWASRSSLLAAANLAFSEFLARGTLPLQALTCVRRLVWVELQLGRVPCVLAWIELMSWIAHHLMLEGDRQETYLEERKNQDIIFGLLLLKTDFWELKWLDFLPGVLEKLQLDYSWMALLYALGYEDRLRAEGVIPEEEDLRAVREFFSKWLAQPAAKDLPAKLELMRGLKIRFHSVIIGCEIEVEATNNLASIFLSETILSALEAFLATGMNKNVFPHRPDFRILIKESESVSGLPEYIFHQDSKEGDLEIKHPEKLDYQSREDRNAFQSWLIDLLAQTIARIFFIRDPEDYLIRFARDEAGFGRALNNSDTCITVTNILGESPKLRLSDWRSDDIKELFPLNRQLPWSEGLENADESKETVSIYQNIGEGAPPQELLDVDKFKHRDLKVFSLINQPLWDKARWKATAYITFPNPNQPPFMALGFSDAEAGKAIFDEWLRKVGRIDSTEQLRVSILTGIDRRKPFSYSVIIGVNPRFKKDTHTDLLILVSRINRMDPSDQVNLNRFVEKYEKMGWYVLLPIHFTDGSIISEPFWEYGITKRELTIRPAWQISEHDPDVVAIKHNDEPIIPDGVSNPPILGVLKKRAKR